MEITTRFERDVMPILFSKINKTLQKQYDEILKPLGLSKFHSFYLMCLYKHKEGLKLNDINDIIGCDKANTSRAITDLEDKNIISRDIFQENERKYSVKLTDYGKNLASKFDYFSNKVYDTMLINLTKKEQELLFYLLKKISL